MSPSSYSPSRPATFFHTPADAEWATRNEFYQRLAHGRLLLSAGMPAGEINPVAFSYGYDRMRFIRPVYIGDTTYVRLADTEREAFAGYTTRARSPWSVYSPILV